MAKKKTGEKKPGEARDRMMVGIEPRYHELLKAIAEKHHRPINWQMELLIEEAAKIEGVINERVGPNEQES